MAARTAEFQRFSRGVETHRTRAPSNYDFDLWESAFNALRSGDQDGGAGAMAAMLARIVEQLTAEYGRLPTIYALRDMADEIEVVSGGE